MRLCLFCIVLIAHAIMYGIDNKLSDNNDNNNIANLPNLKKLHELKKISSDNKDFQNCPRL